jgi:hypothetical protein
VEPQAPFGDVIDDDESNGIKIRSKGENLSKLVFWFLFPHQMVKYEDRTCHRRRRCIIDSGNLLFSARKNIWVVDIILTKKKKKIIF